MQQKNSVAGGARRAECSPRVCQSKTSNKADPGAWGCRGTVRARTALKISGTALQTDMALWCNGIARWYAAVSLGRPALALRHLDARQIERGFGLRQRL